MGGAVAWRRARAFLCALVLVASVWSVPAWTDDRSALAADGSAVRVPILVYHGIDYSGNTYSVTPEQLSEQANWLVQNGYSAVTLGQFWDAALGYATLPPNPVVLTHDDGSSSAMLFAEILGQYGLVGNYFVNNVSPLTPDQIWSLAQWGSVQAHTVTHAAMSGLGYEAQLAEISENKAYIEQITGIPVHFLAWPFGDRDDSAAQAAAAAGIIAAFGLGGTGCHLGAHDPYHIPRIMMHYEDDLATFAAKVSWW